MISVVSRGFTGNIIIMVSALTTSPTTVVVGTQFPVIELGVIELGALDCKQ